MYYGIFVLIRATDLMVKISVKEAIIRNSKLYMVHDERREIMSEVPESVEKLDKMPGTNLSFK